MKAFKKKGTGFPKVGLSKKDIFLFLTSLVISFLVLSGYLFVSQGRLPLPVLPSFARPTPEPTKIVQEKTARAPTNVPAVNKAQLRIKVLNGSGTAGLAGIAKDLLTKAGYQEILTGNADNFDYTKTVIQVKDASKNAVPTLKKDLSDSVDNPKAEKLDEDEAADVVIIIGQDFK